MRRGNYSLKETMLAKRMGAACGLADASLDLDAVVNCGCSDGVVLWVP